VVTRAGRKGFDGAIKSGEASWRTISEVSVSLVTGNTYVAGFADASPDPTVLGPVYLQGFFMSFLRLQLKKATFGGYRREKKGVHRVSSGFFEFFHLNCGFPKTRRFGGFVR
jgi:hypothetical protein